MDLKLLIVSANESALNLCFLALKIGRRPSNNEDLEAGIQSTAPSAPPAEMIE